MTGTMMQHYIMHSRLLQKHQQQHKYDCHWCVNQGSSAQACCFVW
jgi:hypothetical protein